MRLPRLALWLFCLAYVLPGFVGRGPWKNADISSFGYMLALAQGTTDWWQPVMGGLLPEVSALLPYWLGAWAIMLAPAGIAPDLAARIPFMLLLMLALMATWYGTYYLARSPLAQPLAFAFGGEAEPTDYARALADGGVLAMIASLGLAQLAHETTPALAQLCFAALLFYAAAALPYRPIAPGLGAAVGLMGLTLSGAPTLALLLGLGCAGDLPPGIRIPTMPCDNIAVLLRASGVPCHDTGLAACCWRLTCTCGIGAWLGQRGWIGPVWGACSSGSRGLPGHWRAGRCGAGGINCVGPGSPADTFGFPCGLWLWPVWPHC